MESITGTLVIHVAESFELFCVLGVGAVTGSQTLFNLLHLQLFLVSFSCLGVDLHHVLFELFLITIALLFLKLVKEFRLNFRDSAVLDLLPEEQSFQSRHFVILLLHLLCVNLSVSSLECLHFFPYDVLLRLKTLPAHLLMNLLLKIIDWFRIISADLAH